MRLGILALPLLIAASTSDAQRGKRNDTGAIDRACTVADCFYERDIRQFEVIDRTHVIVYTGPQRCPFHVELQGTFCDLTFAPELIFTRTRDMQGRLITRPDQPPPDPLGRDGDFDALDRLEPNRRDLRICGNDLGIQVHGGQFSESVPRSSVGQRVDVTTMRADCRIAAVTAITDDQLLEFFVSRGALAPPPPMGVGEIEVGEQAEQEATAQPDAEEEKAEEE